jgi:hypothetical protein
MEDHAQKNYSIKGGRRVIVGSAELNLKRDYMEI